MHARRSIKMRHPLFSSRDVVSPKPQRSLSMVASIVSSRPMRPLSEHTLIKISRCGGGSALKAKHIPAGKAEQHGHCELNVMWRHRSAAAKIKSINPCCGAGRRRASRTVGFLLCTSRIFGGFICHVSFGPDICFVFTTLSRVSVCVI